ncbi:MAG: EamA family transporter [Georgenia sp.]
MREQTIPAGGAGAAAGLWLALASAATFGTSGAFAKPLLEAGWSPGAAVTARVGGAALVLVVPALVALRGRWHLLRRNATLILAYGLVAMAACQVFYYSAVQTLSVGVALLLEYLGFVLVVGWLWVRHGHRPRRSTVAGVVAAVAGLFLVLDVTGGFRLDLAGVLWGLGAAVGLAVYFVLSARAATGLPPLVMAAAAMVVATVALGLTGVSGLLPMTFSAADVRIAGAEMSWVVPILGVALVSTATAYSTGIAGTRLLGARLASFVGLTEVMFAVLFAWLALGEMPMPIQLLGGALIVGGLMVVRYDELVEARRWERLDAAA